MMKLFFCIVVFLSFQLATSFAKCSQVQLLLDNYSYDLTPVYGVTLRFQVMRGYEPGACKYFITASKGSSQTYNRQLKMWNGVSYPYQVYKDSSRAIVLKDLPDVSNSNEIVSGEFGGGAGVAYSEHFYYLSLRDTSNSPTAGYYSDTFYLNLYEGSFNSSYEYKNSVQMIVQYYLNNVVSLSLVPTGAPFSPGATYQLVDFGNMSTGLERSLDILVSSNSGTVVKLSSQNNGALKHLTKNDKVYYQTSVSGAIVNLSSSQNIPVTVATRTGSSPSGGFRFPVTFKLGTVATQTAGSYSDNITVTVSTNL